MTPAEVHFLLVLALCAAGAALNTYLDYRRQVRERAAWDARHATVARGVVSST